MNMKVTTLILFTCTVILSVVYHGSGESDFLFPNEYDWFMRHSQNTQRSHRRPTPTQPPTIAPATTQSSTFLRCISTCPSTNEYNPICGSDTLTYHNVQRMNCANSCGKIPRVHVVRMGACEIYGRPIFSNF